MARRKRARCGAKMQPRLGNTGTCGRPAGHTGHHSRERRLEAHGYHLKWRYGITREQYDAIKEAQGGKCYICQVANGRTKNLSVDHDHATGEVRGLLCGPCNRHLLPWVERGYDVRAREYLANPPARLVLKEIT